MLPLGICLQGVCWVAGSGVLFSTLVSAHALPPGRSGTSSAYTVFSAEFQPTFSYERWTSGSRKDLLHFLVPFSFLWFSFKSKFLFYCNSSSWSFFKFWSVSCTQGSSPVTLGFFFSPCGSPADPYITTWSANKVLLGSFSSPRDKGKSSHVFCPVHLPPFLPPFSSFFPEEGWLLSVSPFKSETSVTLRLHFLPASQGASCAISQTAACNSSWSEAAYQCTRMTQRWVSLPWIFMNWHEYSDSL